MLTFSSFLVQLFGSVPGLQCMIDDPPKPKTSFLHQLKNAVLTTPQETRSQSARASPLSVWEVLSTYHPILCRYSSKADLLL